MDELLSRRIPWTDEEFALARNRPHAERVPLPEPGDQVWYRRHHWNRDLNRRRVEGPELARVIRVQDFNDYADRNLWKPVPGAPRPDTQVIVRVPDPWPYLILERPEGRGHACTREARVRGAAGWLPLDYRDRPERMRLPHETARIVLPTVAVGLDGVVVVHRGLLAADSDPFASAIDDDFEAGGPWPLSP